MIYFLQGGDQEPVKIGWSKVVTANSERQMARTLKGKGKGKGKGKDEWHGANTPAEEPFIVRLAAIEDQIQALREDKKEIKIEIRAVNLRVQPIMLAVKRYRETEEQRLAREEIESEAERILRALGLYADTPLGQAAVDLATARYEASEFEPFDPLGDPPEAA